MLTVNSSFRLGWKFGSIVSPAPVETSLTPGYHGCGRNALGAGSGAFTPSTPTRNAVTGVVWVLLVPQVPVFVGPVQVAGCINPGVSIGTRIGLTPLMRPKIRE